MKLDFTTAKHKIIHTLMIDLIPNDWKHLPKTETSQKKNTFYCFKALPYIIPIKTLGK